MKKQYLIPFISIIFLCFLGVQAFFAFKNFHPQSFKDCDQHFAKDNKDICLLELAINSINKDYQAFKELRLEIRQPAIRNYLERFAYRPHMFSFVHASASLGHTSLRDNSKICQNYPAKLLPFRCVEFEAAQAALTQPMDGLELCSNLSASALKAECQYIVISFLIENGPFPSPDQNKQWEHLCQKIENPNWKSECYYSIADNIALKAPQSVNEITYNCDKSNLENNLRCFDHVLHFMQKKDALNYCHHLVQEFESAGHTYSTLTLEEVLNCFGTGKALEHQENSPHNTIHSHHAQNVYDHCKAASPWNEWPKENGYNFFFRSCFTKALRWLLASINVAPKTFYQQCSDSKSIEERECIYFAMKLVSRQIPTSKRISKRERIKNQISFCSENFKKDSKIHQCYESVLINLFKSPKVDQPEEFITCDFFPSDFHSACSELTKLYQKLGEI